MSGRWIRIEAGRYRHVPSGYTVVQYVRREGAWRVLDGGSHEVFSAGTFAAAKAWVDALDSAPVLPVRRDTP